MTELDIPELSLVVLVGASGSGKSTFARTHFAPTEVISSDFCRGLIADDENDQSATKDAFDVLHYIAGKRLAAGRLTVIDATNVQPDSRKHLIDLAKDHDVLPAAIVLDLPERVCVARNKARPDRTFGPQVISRQRDQLRRGLRSLSKEGFRRIHVLRSQAEIDEAVVVRTKLYNDLRDRTGPFDVVGDVHGCLAELESLLTELGYELRRDDRHRAVGARHVSGSRTAVFLGDLVDRGPDTPGVLRLVLGMVRDGDALCVPGNHENKLLRAMRGRNVQVSHGLAESLAQLAAEPDEFRAEVESFIDGLVSHYVLDGGKLVVSHAGLTERLQGRASARVRSFCLYGQTTGETDEFGLPVRYPWANDYRGRAMVLYGHTPVPSPEWVNGTLCLDTGCVFGGRLTALKYPEREIVSVPATRVYYESVKPFPVSRGAAPADVLDLDDVAGRRAVETGYHGRITVREANAAAALEVMSRFALDPRWLMYLPPTMSPVATSQAPGLLEHPDQAFDAYRDDGVDRVVCEEKHMGSRAVALVCADSATAATRFGAACDATGAVWTRTGRSFFGAELTEDLLARLRAAAHAAGLFDELGTSWLLFDAELLPWSAKAEELLRTQYAAVGAAAGHALPAAVNALEMAEQSGLDVTDLLDRTRSRSVNSAAFTAAYRRYCWPTDGLDGVRIAPFQLLASDGATYARRPHDWHLAIADRLVGADPELVAPTSRIYVDVNDAASVGDATRWWERLTAGGGRGGLGREGMVVKPAANLVRGRRGLVQPGLKVRGREYLRIIYGPDYTEQANLDRLRNRGLGHKRSLAEREYALGLEALDRLARGEPLWRIHECVFAVLALESEPVDPRL
ncbi:MAG TPA: polynucleotide kinase-phosphatase [Streptosporangiaceae bacterium]|nr:polynucleotide kinase-phosphatase [Streptosporangiaceae bacterium]